MAQVGVQYPSLQGLFSGPMAGWLGADQYQNAQKNDELNRQQSLEDLTTKQVNRPLDMQVKQMGLAKSAAELPGIFARSSQEQDKATMSRKTLDPAIQAELTKIAAQTTSDDLKNQEAQLTQLISNPNTPEQIRQTLLKARDYFPDLYKERMKLDSQRSQAESVAHIQGGYSNENARIGATSREKVADTSASARTAAATKIKSTEQLIRESKTATERHQKLVDAAKEAEQAGNTALADSYAARAEEIRPQAVEELKKGRAPEIDVPSVANMPAAPGPQISPKGSPPPDKDIQKAVTAAGWTYEPTKYDYRIGPDGKVQRKLKGK